MCCDVRLEQSTKELTTYSTLIAVIETECMARRGWLPSKILVLSSCMLFVTSSRCVQGIDSLPMSNLMPMLCCLWLSLVAQTLPKSRHSHKGVLFTLILVLFHSVLMATFTMWNCSTRQETGERLHTSHRCDVYKQAELYPWFMSQTACSVWHVWSPTSGGCPLDEPCCTSCTLCFTHMCSIVSAQHNMLYKATIATVPGNPRHTHMSCYFLEKRHTDEKYTSNTPHVQTLTT